MKTVTETGRIAYKFRLFGWHITISNAPVKFKQTGSGGSSANYNNLLSKRRRIAMDKCERCGRSLSIFGRLYHILPVGHPNRNETDNVRIMCNSCYRAVIRNGAPLSICNHQQEGGQA